MDTSSALMRNENGTTTSSSSNPETSLPTRSKPATSESSSAEVSKHSSDPPSHSSSSETKPTKLSLREEIAVLRQELQRCTAEVQKHGKELRAHSIIAEDHPFKTKNRELQNEVESLKQQKATLEVEVENFRMLFASIEKITGTEEIAPVAKEEDQRLRNEAALEQELAAQKDHNRALSLEIRSLRKPSLKTNSATALTKEASLQPNVDTTPSDRAVATSITASNSEKSLSAKLNVALGESGILTTGSAAAQEAPQASNLEPAPSGLNVPSTILDFANDAPLPPATTLRSPIQINQIYIDTPLPPSPPSPFTPLLRSPYLSPFTSPNIAQTSLPHNRSTRPIYHLKSYTLTPLSFLEPQPEYLPRPLFPILLREFLFHGTLIPHVRGWRLGGFVMGVREEEEENAERLKRTEGVLCVREGREELLPRVEGGSGGGGEPDWDEMTREQERDFAEEKAMLELELLGTGRRLRKECGMIAGMVVLVVAGCLSASALWKVLDVKDNLGLAAARTGLSLVLLILRIGAGF
jgi:hypothetical protein